MAEWKKLIVSGGEAHVAGITSSVLTNNNILVAGTLGQLEDSGLTYDGSTLTLGSSAVTNTSNNASLSGSFSGSFTGDGTGLTGLTADFPTIQNGALADGDKFFTNGGSNTFVSGTQVQDYVYSGVSGDITIAAGGAATIATSLGALGTNEFTGSFTGSFIGDGSELTGIATNLTVSASNGTNETLDLKDDRLVLVGGTNITTTVAEANNDVKFTVDLDSTLGGDITFSGDTVTVQKDLIVQGTASFQNTTNLQVADQFILLNSGSTTTADGGIVIQQASQDVGELFGWDAGTNRWAVTSSFSASSTAFTPLAYMPLVINSDDNDVSAYQKDGNIKISTAGDIYIYVE